MATKQHITVNAEQISNLEMRGLELEYTTLRNEILKRIELRQQIIAVALTLAGVFLGVGVTKEIVVLIYPPLATFLAFGWAQNDSRIRSAAKYIRENIEPRLGLGFEKSNQEERKIHSSKLGSWRFIVVSHGGIFLASQLMAIGIELSRLTFSPLKWGLLLTDIFALAIVSWLLRKVAR